jgi:hypothetical protein
VSRRLALILFPFVPTRAAERLAGSWLGAIVPALALLSVAVYLKAKGGGTGDVAAATVGLARVLGGVALGGLGASWIAARVAGREASMRALAGPVLAAAGWAPAVFVVFLLLMHAGGASSAAALFAGIALLIWGVAAGFGIVGGEEECEPGRLLVASCFGLGGVLIGLWVALAAPPAAPVQLVPSPVAREAIRPGDLLLVARSDADAEGDLVLLRDPGSHEAALAVRDRNGSLTPVGPIQVSREKLQDWNIAGHVFFRFGAGGGEIVVPAEQKPKRSRD